MMMRKPLPKIEESGALVASTIGFMAPSTSLSTSFEYRDSTAAALQWSAGSLEFTSSMMLILTAAIGRNKTYP